MRDPLTFSTEVANGKAKFQVTGNSERAYWYNKDWVSIETSENEGELAYDGSTDAFACCAGDSENGHFYFEFSLPKTAETPTDPTPTPEPTPTPDPTPEATSPDGTITVKSTIIPITSGGKRVQFDWTAPSNPPQGWWISRTGTDKYGNTGTWNTLLKDGAARAYGFDMADNQTFTFGITRVDDNQHVDLTVTLGDPSATPAPTPVPDPDTTPAPAPTGNGTELRALSEDRTNWIYRDHSNDPIDPKSAEVVAHLVESISRPGRPLWGFNTGNYSFSQFYADENTPREDVVVTDPWAQFKMGGRHGYDVLDDGRPGFKNVPIPPGAIGAPGSDASLAIHDKKNNTIYECWQFRRGSDGRLYTTQGGRERNASQWDGRWTPGLGVAGAGVSMAHTNLGIADFDRVIAGGEFDRAFYIVLNSWDVAGGHYYPATRTDGYSDPDGHNLWFVEGMRFILPKDTVLPSTLTPFARKVAEAMMNGHPIIPLDRMNRDGAAHSLESTPGLVASFPERFKTESDAYAVYNKLFGGRDQWSQFTDFPWDKLVLLDTTMEH